MAESVCVRARCVCVCARASGPPIRRLRSSSESAAAAAAALVVVAAAAAACSLLSHRQISLMSSAAARPSHRSAQRIPHPRRAIPIDSHSCKLRLFFGEPHFRRARASRIIIAPLGFTPLSHSLSLPSRATRHSRSPLAVAVLRALSTRTLLISIHIQRALRHSTLDGRIGAEPTRERHKHSPLHTPPRAEQQQQPSSAQRAARAQIPRAALHIRSTLINGRPEGPARIRRAFEIGSALCPL